MNAPPFGGVFCLRLIGLDHGLDIQAVRPIAVRFVADTAMRLARYFGTSPDVWLRLQARYDLDVAQREYGDRIDREVKVLTHS